MRILIAVAMLVCIAGLWQYNKQVTTKSQAAAIAAENHKPFQPVASRPLQTAPRPQFIASERSTPASTSTGGSQFTCDGRTHCSQMRSCAEATYFIQHCPNTKMDGNNDGVPCEQQWCN